MPSALREEYNAAPHTNAKLEVLKRWHLRLINEDHRAAYVLANEVLANFRRESDEAGLIGAYEILGDNYRQRSMPKVALEWYLKGLPYFEARKEYTGLSYMQSNLGNCYFDMRSMDLAVQHFEQALRLARQAGNNHAAGVAINNLGLVEEWKKNYEKALKLHLEAQATRRALRDTDAMIYDYKVIAHTYVGLAKYDIALQYLDSAMAIASVETNPNRWVEIRYLRADVHRLQGKKDVAIKELETLLPQAQKYNQTELGSLVRLELSRLYLATGNYAGVPPIINPVLNGKMRSSSFATLHDLHYTLSEAYRLMGQDHSALAHYGYAVAYNDSLRANEMQRSSATSYAVYQMQLKEGELQQIKSAELSTAQRLSKEIARNRILIIGTIIALLLLFVIGLTFIARRKRTAALQRQNKLIARQKADLDNHARQLEKARQLAEKSLEAKSQFLGNMSHEIRTPMNAIIGYTELMMENPNRAENTQYIRSIHHAATNLLVVINDILDFSKIEAGEVQFESIPFRLENMLNEIRRMLHINWPTKHLDLWVEIADNVPEWLRGDPTRIYQILLNLSNNAMKFTEKGEVRISITNQVMAGDMNKLTFRVSDTGIGIDADKLPDIFKNYRQAGADTSRLYGGTGLGLAISKRLVDQMGGAIDVKSEKGKGSTFTFSLTLPKARGDEAPAKAQPAELSIKSKSLPLEQRHILCAEDNLLNQHLIRQILESWGAGVTIVSDGRKAVEAVRAFRYDLVLMDVQMPIMDGLEATRKIRHMSDNPLAYNLPIFGLTADVMEETRIAAGDAGMDGVILKPINKTLLLETILSHLGSPSVPDTPSMKV